jgi:threonine/homoserine/homoserine lactone efflux protein
MQRLKVVPGPLQPARRGEMLGVHDLPVFIVAGLVLNMTPGPDTFYILGRSLSQGRGAGIVSALAISTGCLFHTTAAALGLSALLAKSAFAFELVRYAGAAYLIYLGARMIFLRGAQSEDDAKVQPAASLWAIYRQGVLTNVLNPKVALFFLAFLPQFIDPATQTRVAAFLLLGIIFTFNGTLWCIALAYFAAQLSGRLRTNRAAHVTLHRGTGVLFVGLGAKLAFSRR